VEERFMHSIRTYADQRGLGARGSLEIAIVPWRDRSNVVLDDFAVNKAGDNRAQLLQMTVLPEYQLTFP
jgi:hypothetical protein